MSKTYSRKKDVADRYKTTPRNVERMAADGRIPKPFYLNGSRIPLWDNDQLDENDRAAVARPREHRKLAREGLPAEPATAA
jgi:hypothetical protein